MLKIYKQINSENINDDRREDIYKTLLAHDTYSTPGLATRRTHSHIHSVTHSIHRFDAIFKKEQILYFVETLLCWLFISEYSLLIIIIDRQVAPDSRTKIHRQVYDVCVTTYLSTYHNVKNE